MKIRKICAAAVSVAMTAGMLTCFPTFEQTLHATSEFVSNDFEISYEGWAYSGDLTQLTAIDDIGHNSSRGMLVSNRQSVLDGAYSEKGLYIDGGFKYHYSIFVYQNALDSDNFHLSLSYLKKDDTTEMVDIATKQVKRGKWTEISTDFAAPEGAVNLTVSITTDSTEDFRFDDLKITGKSTDTLGAVMAANNNYGLKDKYAKYFKIGSVLNGNTVKNSTITATILKDFNSITCENETKPDATMNKNASSGNNIAASLNGAAGILDFCSKNNIGLRGHTLVWHSQTPQWVFKEGFNDNGAWVNESTMDQRLESYIKNMFNAYKTQYPNLNLYAYDVCNECMSDDANRSKNNGGSREPGYGNGKSPWVQVYGSNKFIEKAFTFARKYAPESCSLFYNDYNEYWDHKRDCIAKECESLYKKGVLDGIGMQSHIGSEMEGFTGVSTYTTALKKFAAIGCQVQITELDISIDGGKYTLQQQAQKYKAIFQAALDINTKGTGGKVTALVVWGPNDANTWIKTENAPLLFDVNNNPKPAYDAVASLVPDGDVVVVTEAPVTANSKGQYFNSTFESSTDGWSGRGGANVDNTTSAHNQGNGALYVSGRTDAWNGASFSLKSSAFKAGNSYAFSAMVMQDSGSSEPIHLKLQYTDSNAETQYVSIAEGTTSKGKWTQLANPSFAIPAGASNLELYVETPENLIDFYVDDVIGADKGKIEILPASQPESDSDSLMYGDITGDKVIDVTDLTALSLYLLKSKDFDETQMKKADVTGNGTIDLADLAHLKQYIMEDPVTLGPKDAPKEDPPKDDPPETDPNLKVPDTAKMESIFSGLNLQKSLKTDNNNNPLYTQRFGADPGFMVYKDRLYVFTTNDAFEYNGNNLRENAYDVGTINCCSSADLVNWTDHGAIPVAGRNGRTQNGAAKWASCSWAPDAAWKTINGKDKFFLYFANSGGGIGVLTADSPTGPWTDPLGHALLTGGSPNCSDVVWMFDPGVMVDDDGTGYLFFGGGVDNRDKANPGTGRCVKLGADMISLAGNPVKMSTPYLFEDSSICKIGDTYYYSYCSNWNVPGGTNINGQSFGSGDICYMTSKSPLGPYTFAGRAFANTGGQGLDKGGNNHHSICEFKGKYYVLYHTRVVENRMNITKNYRSPSISEASVANGKITCKGSHDGVPQLELLNPYEKVEAETMSNQTGMVDQSTPAITVNGVGNTVVSANKPGAWIKVSGVDFSKGAKKISVRVSSKSGAAIKICTGSASGKAVGYVDVQGTNGQMVDISAPISGLTGKQDIYFVFSNQAEFDSWQFS